MIYLSLDQSLNTTGWAIFTQASEIKLLDYGIFNIKPTKPIEQRLAEIHKNLNEITKEYQIEYVFLEDIQYQNNKETFKKLAYVQSQIFTWCYWNDINFTVLSPSHWRKIISDNFRIKFGKARAEQKTNAYNFAINKYHLSPDNTTEDEADAIALGTAGIIEKESNTSEW